jgi:flavodoxin
MNVIVTYMSLSGNTEKVAEAIYEEIRERKEIKPMDEVNSLEAYDLVFFGFPMHGFGCPEEGQDFLKNHCQGRQVVLFVTHGAPEYSEELQPWLEACREAAAGTEVVGMFNCQGELAQYVADHLLASDNPRHRAWGEGRESTIGQPDESRLQKAREFAREVMKKIEN